MQTFLPYDDLELSIVCLDWKRLGKQRVEGKQILNSLDPAYTKRGWKNHPAVKMWRGYKECLKLYTNMCIYEWIRRGYNNTMEFFNIDKDSFRFPDWWGGPIHSSHRANLLRKDSIFYGRYGWTENPEEPYYWPTNE